MSAPWLKFFPTDWRADPALRMCSVAARGLWMEMLCVMHEAEPRGSLRINGKAVTDRQLASLAGCPDISEFLIELEEAGVFSREEDGTIYSRRMVRDAEKAEEDKANGKRGGNPQLKGGVNPPDKAQKPEARVQTEDAIASKTRAKADPEFEDWYSHYPHKVQRGDAERAFVKARFLADLEELIAGVQRYVASKPTDRQWLNPATWLNRKSWLDAPASVMAARSTSPPTSAEPRNAGERARMKLNGTLPHEPPHLAPERLDSGDRRGQIEGTGIARRITLATDEFRRNG